MWGKGAREPRPYAPTPLMTRQGLSRFDSPGSYAVCGVSDAAPDPSLVLQTPCLCVAYAFDTASAQVRRTAKAKGGHASTPAKAQGFFGYAPPCACCACACFASTAPVPGLPYLCSTHTEGGDPDSLYLPKENVKAF